MKASETLWLSQQSSNLVIFFRACLRELQEHWHLCRHVAVSQWDVEK